METTGPKTSSVSTRAPAGTSVRTVGQWKVPSRLPPVLTVAPASTASAHPGLHPLRGGFVDQGSDVGGGVALAADHQPLGACDHEVEK